VLQKQEVSGLKKKGKRLKNATQKLGRDKARKKAHEREQGRDYEQEWAILQEKHQDEMQMKVADAMWNPASSSSSSYQREDCSYHFRGPPAS
jgi:hypothetical protein